MKTRLMIVAAVMTLQDGQAEVIGENGLIVYFENRLAPKEDFLAKSQIEQMFGSVGVRIVWRNGTPSSATIAKECPIVVHFVLRTTVSDHPGALAFALPFEGIHVKVFYDRVRLADSRLTQAVLAHVLVHEMTHLLQGMDRHSQTGIMKAHWTADDYREMTWSPLSFTAEDIELIRAGLKARKGPECRIHT